MSGSFAKDDLVYDSDKRVYVNAELGLTFKYHPCGGWIVRRDGAWWAQAYTFSKAVERSLSRLDSAEAAPSAGTPLPNGGAATNT